MSKTIIGFVFICVFVFSVSAQTNEARKIDEFREISCEDVSVRVESLLNELKNVNFSARIYIIFYEGNHEGKRPRRGEAQNRAKETVNYLIHLRKDFTKSNYVLANGGYRKDFAIEFWIVPKGAKEPAPSLTVDKNTIKFGKGKSKVRDCAHFY